METIQIKQIHSDKFFIEFNHDKQLNIYVFPTDKFKGKFDLFDKEIDRVLTEVFSKEVKDADLAQEEELQNYDPKLLAKKDAVYFRDAPEEVVIKSKPIELKSIKDRVFGQRGYIHKFWSGDSWGYSTYIINPFIDELMLEVSKKLEGK